MACENQARWGRLLSLPAVPREWAVPDRDLVVMSGVLMPEAALSL